MVTRTFLCIPILLFVASHSLAWDQFTFHHVNVLGTQLELRLDCATSEQATEAESIALNEIDRLANILSSYDPQSELNRWLTDGKGAKLSRACRGT